MVVRGPSQSHHIRMYDPSFGKPLQPPKGLASASEPRRIGLGLFHHLHDDTIFRIIKMLPDHDVLTLSQASRAFYFYASDDLYVWKRRCLNRWKPDFAKFSWKGTWKRSALLPSQKTSARPLLRIALPSGFYSPRLCAQWYRQYVPLERFAEFRPGHIPIERRSNLSVEEFIEKYDKPGKPVIVTDALTNWPARENWQIEALLRRFQSHEFKTDEVVDGKKIRMPFANYMAYFANNTDDDPIYLFDPDFAEHAPELLADFAVPAYFREDLLAVLGEAKRPLYRWWVVGPARSGSCFHLDPYATSAWNALLLGRKRWLLYPPGQVPPGVDDEVDSDGEHSYDAPDPLAYMVDEWPALPPGRPAMECVLEAGEMIFVPSGWWHMVVNLTDTVAITQNVMNRQNFWHVYDDVRRDDRKMKRRLKKKLKKLRPDVYRDFLQRPRPTAPAPAGSAAPPAGEPNGKHKKKKAADGSRSKERKHVSAMMGN